MSNKIPGSAENWESGDLGLNAESAVAASHDEAAAIDRATGLNMQLISIRLQAELISQMKEIAVHHGVGYQPLIRDVLQRWAAGELAAILELRASEAKKRKKDLDKTDSLAGEIRKRA